ncbi:MAG: hypothetical protein K9J42_00440 [Sulfuritalea sp.]|nr:hypothetical protein [Sulfuritalea sp.]
MYINNYDRYRLIDCRNRLNRHRLSVPIESSNRAFCDAGSAVPPAPTFLAPPVFSVREGPCYRSRQRPVGAPESRGGGWLHRAGGPVKPGKSALVGRRENSALMKQLMRHLRSKKEQDKTLPASLRMRYKAVEQETLSFADLEYRIAGRPLRRSGWRYGGHSALAAIDDRSVYVSVRPHPNSIVCSLFSFVRAT